MQSQMQFNTFLNMFLKYGVNKGYPIFSESDS